jgi:hypothetical protein
VIEFTYRRIEPLQRSKAMNVEQTTAELTESEPVAAKRTGSAKRTKSKGATQMSTSKTSTEKMKTEEMNADEMNSEEISAKPVPQEPTGVERLEQVLEELRKPFHPSHITWKPGVMAKSGDKALALAYGDLRAYQNRLDEVCGANWSVTYTPWAGPDAARIICNLTIFGVTRSSTGEGDGDSERNEIAGTVAEAQAFKRACAMFGLGRYLYSLPSVWAEYDKDRRQFTEPAKAKLLSILMQHYRRAASGPAGPNAGAGGDFQPEPAELSYKEQPTNGRAVNEQGANGQGTNGHGKHGHSESAPQVAPLEPLRRQLDELGRNLYGEQWEQVRQRNVQRVSGGEAKSSGELTGEQIQKLIDGMKKLMAQRVVA